MLSSTIAKNLSGLLRLHSSAGESPASTQSFKNYAEYAEKEFNKITNQMEGKLRKEKSAEADAQGLNRQDKGKYINAAYQEFKIKREEQRAATVERRTKELAEEIPKDVEKCKPIGDLPACANDIS